MGGRQRAIAVLTVYVVGCTLFWVEYGISDTYPVPWILTLLALAGINLTAGALLGWRWIALVLLFPVGGIVTGSIKGDPAYTKTLVGFLLIVPTAALFALGVASGPLVRRLAGVPLVLTAGALALLIALPLPIALINKHRTVRVTGARPTLIDETRGTVRGIGLGTSRTQVISVFGPPPRPWTGRDPVGPLNGDPANPGSIPAAGLHSKTDVLRYPDYSFFLQDDRVWSIEIIDRGAHTKRGLGVGDSISLIQKAYPQLDCHQDDRGEDEPDPYPVCSGQTGPYRYMFFGGDYAESGSPVKSITIFSRPLR
jgi:hypothetical protein